MLPRFGPWRERERQLTDLMHVLKECNGATKPHCNVWGKLTCFSCADEVKPKKSDERGRKVKVKSREERVRAEEEDENLGAIPFACLSLWAAAAASVYCSYSPGKSGFSVREGLAASAIEGRASSSAAAARATVERKYFLHVTIAFNPVETSSDATPLPPAAASAENTHIRYCSSCIIHSVHFGIFPHNGRED